MRKNSVLAIAFLVLLASPFSAFAQKESSLNADLNRLLASFAKKKTVTEDDIRKIPNFYEASGTLFFFDNSENTRKKMSPAEMKANMFKDMIRSRAEKKREQAAAATQTYSRLKDWKKTEQRPDDAPTQGAAQAGPKVMRLANYDGPKIAAAIPPDTYVEAPFLSHFPYIFSRIDILGNGSIKVTETVERIVEPGETGFTGIDRTFSKYNPDRSGRKTRSSVIPLEATIDQIPVEPKLTPIEGGIKMSVRRKQPMEPGVHLIVYSYLFEDKIAAYTNAEKKDESFKELIWNVTGANFDYPVLRAGAIVIYPQGADILTRTGFSGAATNLREDLKIRRDGSNDTSFVLTFPLAPYENFLIVTSWAEPGAVAVYDSVFDRFLRNHGTAVLSFIAFLFIASYYLATWTSLKKGQLKKSTRAAPLKKDDVSPAVIRYARAGKAGPKALFVLLLSLAGKGVLKFSEENGKLTLIKTTDDLKKLTALEKIVAKRLFPKETTSLPLTAENALKLKRLLSVADKKIAREHALKFMSFEAGYFWFGILMAVVAFAAVSSLSPFPVLTAKTAAFGIAFFVPLYYAFRAVVGRVKAGDWTNDRKALIVPSLFSVAFAAALWRILILYARQTTAPSAFWFLAILVCVAAFYSLLKTKSLLGSTIMDSMDAYAAYLTNQDDTLLSTMRTAAFKIKALYAKHLPFAVALGVEREWTRRFASFDQAQGDLSPDWYRGDRAFDENLVDALFELFSAVFPAPKSALRTTRPMTKKK